MNLTKSFVNKMELNGDYMLIRLSCLHMICKTIQNGYDEIWFSKDDFPCWDNEWTPKLKTELEFLGYAVYEDENHNDDDSFFYVSWCDKTIIVNNIDKTLKDNIGFFKCLD